MFVFVFRKIFKRFGKVWIGMWHDTEYTYVIDGTKENNNKTSVDWFSLTKDGDRLCGLIVGYLDNIEQTPCYHLHPALCELPICKN